MKTLINKHNPQIRITAPEITTAHPPVSNEGYVYWIPAINQMYSPIDWALVEEQPTCKTCGFYENNCPFIRGKFVPYPNKVCKDYIHSAMKEQKPVEGIKWNLEEVPSNVNLEKEVEMEWESFNKHAAEYGEDVVWLNWNSFVDVATHFYKLGKNSK